MPDDLSLFGDDEPAVPQTQVSAPPPIADWQVELLRKALESRDLTSMSERQQAVEDAAGRPVESLRALTSEEAMAVLTKLGRAPAPEQRATSSWDDREEDTWIDRL